MYEFTARGLSVGYDGRALIRDIDIQLGQGEILTLIGPNGSGKSTILKTVTRQLALISGAVYLGRDELGRLSYRELSTRMSVMLTERIAPELMTCFDVVASGRYPYTNRFGQLTPRDREITLESLARVRALELSECDFNRLSDGQRQRVLLARAICQQPRIMVLDEPSSALDPISEYRFNQDFEACSRDKTVVYVSHRLATVRYADYIYVLAGGRIVERGTHAELVSRAGLYAEMWHAQADRYADVGA